MNYELARVNKYHIPQLNYNVRLSINVEKINHKGRKMYYRIRVNQLEKIGIAS